MLFVERQFCNLCLHHFQGKTTTFAYHLQTVSKVGLSFFFFSTLLFSHSSSQSEIPNLMKLTLKLTKNYIVHKQNAYLYIYI